MSAGDAFLDATAARVLARLVESLDGLYADRGLRTAEAAKKLGVGVDKLRDMERSGEIPRRNTAGTFSTRQLDEYLRGDWKPSGRRR